jgi:ribulose-phosphate 3-epimerase
MIENPFTTTQPLITASILSADFGKLGAEIVEVLDAGADFIHLDILDGHFAPNISFGPAVTAGARPYTKAYFDAHLMITDPLKYGPPMVKAGAQHLSFHIELPGDHVRMAQELRKLGCHVGIVINPPTPVEKIYPVLDYVDVVLVMSVIPGFSGQKFMPEVLPKCREIRKRLRKDQRMEIDGGINVDTIKAARDAGVDWFVVANAIFGQKDRYAAVADLRKALGA